MFKKARIGMGAAFFILFGWLVLQPMVGVDREVVVANPHLNQKICFIGDTGTGEPEQYQVAAQLNAENAGAIFILGDLFYPAGLKSKDDPRFKTDLADVYEADHVFVVNGNHDNYRKGRRVIEAAALDDRITYPAHYYTVKYGKMCMLMFESSIYESVRAGKFERAQNKYIKEFTERKDCKVKFAMAHHPYKSSSKHGDAEGRLKRMYEDLLIGKVDFVIGGHDHVLSSEGDYLGTRAYVSGAGAKLRTCLRSRRICMAELGYLCYEDDTMTFHTLKELL